MIELNRGPQFRPCGACGELVSVETGCRHWKPTSTAGRKPTRVAGRAVAVALPAPKPVAPVVRSSSMSLAFIGPARPPWLQDPANPQNIECTCGSKKPRPHLPECAKLGGLPGGQAIL